MLSLNSLKHATFVVASLFVAVAASGQTVQTLFESGPKDERINVVILAEGFTEAELPSFPNHATELANHFFSEDPFAFYKHLFNAYAISVSSNESGADIPSENVAVDTAFDATFESAGIDRLLTVNSSKVLNVLNQTVPEYDIILVLVNSTRYGGSGGFVAVASLNPSAFEIAAHELGHSFGGLTDEYESQDSNPREAPNATAETDREKVKWKAWFEADTPVPTPEEDPWTERIGLFEGATYRSEDWYRPHFDSKMRSLNRPWGAVNVEQLTLRIFQSVPLYKNPSPSQTFIPVTQPDPLTFSVEKLFDEMEVSWFVDGELVSSGSSSYQVSPDTLTNGIHSVEVRVSTTSAFVRKDPLESLYDPFFWTLDLNLPPADTSVFNNWILERIPDPQGQRGPQDDPDADGLSNLAEFYFGTNPLATDAESSLIRTGQENGVLYLDVFRESAPALVEAYIEGSSDLVFWDPIAKSEFGQPFEPVDGPIILPLSSETDFQRIFDSDKPADGLRRFLRLRFTLPTNQ